MKKLFMLLILGLNFIIFDQGRQLYGNGQGWAKGHGKGQGWGQKGKEYGVGEGYGQKGWKWIEEVPQPPPPFDEPAG